MELQVIYFTMYSYLDYIGVCAYTEFLAAILGQGRVFWDKRMLRVLHVVAVD